VAVRHRPWVGNLFCAGSHRLMILGESHHGDDPGATDVTVAVVERWLSGDTSATYKFFTNIAVALSGEEPWRLRNATARSAVFSRIMFYNYLLAIMSGPRAKPTRENFSESEQAFRNILELYRPNHIVVCGKRLWNQLPYFDPPDKKEGGKQILAGSSFWLAAIERKMRWRLPCACSTLPASASMVENGIRTCAHFSNRISASG